MNPALKRLGFGDRDRVVVIHADDVGMCQASVSAFVELVDFGLVSSGAAMVPCSWFPLLARECRRHQGLDLGVHLTLTSEWDGYRWGPISTRDPASGLMDGEGYFHRRREDVQAHAEIQAVQAEMEAQLARALAAGVDVSHLDTHMGAVAHLKFVPGYAQLALQQRLPALFLRLEEAGWQALGLDAPTAAFARQFMGQLEEQGVPLLDGLASLPLVKEPGDRIAAAKAALSALPPGLAHFIIHPAADSPELRAITATWQSRVADYRAFTSDELARWVKDSGLQIIGYRPLRDLMRP
ncbi:MAG: ChbG/HpnK family deacetylase [Chloroflexi bacterium]|nr:MAG: ChbG/HpnK family deacetylase [Chloroflexota bacterium]